MTKKNARTKNPCIICFKKVKVKTGLQCQGVCKKWAHYDCLNYSPGKIQDIKAGLLKVVCPCPACDTEVANEAIARNPNYTCMNEIYPVNSLPLREFEDRPNKSTSAFSLYLECPIHPCALPPKRTVLPEGHVQFFQKAKEDACFPPPSAECAAPFKTATKHKMTQLNQKRWPPQTSQSYTCLTKDKGVDLAVQGASSAVFNNQNLMGTVERLCDIIRQLTCQVQELMCRLEEMKQS